MKNCLFQEVFFLLCFGQLVLVTETLIFGTTQRPPSMCVDNRNADSYITGDTQNAVQNFLHVINAKGTFALTGDTSAQSDGCRRTSDQYKHRKGRLYNGHSWTLDCWDPFECTLIEDGILFKLIPVSIATKAPVRVRTVLLPLDQHETSSYTFLPSATQHNIFFVTAMLSGCSFFIAKPNNRNCNLIVIHTNYRCNNTGIDYNHEQAMAVIEEVHNTNKQCIYQINRRWAEKKWKSTVDTARYDYRSRVFYYDVDDSVSFLYGNHLGGYDGKWQFCIKAAKPNPPPETCYDI